MKTGIGLVFRGSLAAPILFSADLPSQIMKTFLPAQKLLHRLKTYSPENRFPTICPVVSQQALHHIHPPNSFLSFWLAVQVINNPVDFTRVIIQMNDSIWPVEMHLESFSIWTFPDHNRARRGPFKIAIANFDLLTRFVGLIYQSWIDQKVTAPSSSICEKSSVLT